MKDDVSAVGSLSQFQPPSGHCQCSRRSTSRSPRSSMQAEENHRQKRVPLLRRTAPMAALDHRHGGMLVRVLLPSDLDLARRSAA